MPQLFGSNVQLLRDFFNVLFCSFFFLSQNKRKLSKNLSHNLFVEKSGNCGFLLIVGPLSRRIKCSCLSFRSALQYVSCLSTSTSHVSWFQIFCRIGVNSLLCKWKGEFLSPSPSLSLSISISISLTPLSLLCGCELNTFTYIISSLPFVSSFFSFWITGRCSVTFLGSLLF
jgi:hypothetical protein